MAGPFVDNSSSFRTVQTAECRNGGLYMLAYVGSGIDGDTPVYVTPNESGPYATALAASYSGYVGVPLNGSIASGCVGAIQIAGYRAGIQCTAAGVTGSIGAPLVWTAAAVYATATATGLGLPNGTAEKVGILYAAGNASTTANVYLTGRWATPV
jgi:hypothetical protein